jgi:hypothetical protein
MQRLSVTEPRSVLASGAAAESAREGAASAEVAAEWAEVAAEWAEVAAASAWAWVEKAAASALRLARELQLARKPVAQRSELP